MNKLTSKEQPSTDAERAERVSKLKLAGVAAVALTSVVGASYAAENVEVPNIPFLKDLGLDDPTVLNDLPAK